MVTTFPLLGDSEGRVGPTGGRYIMLQVVRKLKLLKGKLKKLKNGGIISIVDEVNDLREELTHVQKSA